MSYRLIGSYIAYIHVVVVADIIAVSRSRQPRQHRTLLAGRSAIAEPLSPPRLALEGDISSAPDNAHLKSRNYLELVHQWGDPSAFLALARLNWPWCPNPVV